MPPFKKVPDLRDLSADLMASNLHKSLLYLDSIWKPPPLVSPGSTPSNSPCTSPTGSLATRGILPPLESMQNDPQSVELLRKWLFQMPLLLIELVLERVLQKIETIVHEDKDCKYEFLKAIFLKIVIKLSFVVCFQVDIDTDQYRENQALGFLLRCSCHLQVRVVLRDFSNIVIKLSFVVCFQVPCKLQHH